MVNWRTYAAQTSDLVLGVLRESPDLLGDIAGAVLALHQDTLLAFGIDLNRTDDNVWNLAMDKLQPNRLGKYPERFMIVMKQLPEMDNAWLDFIAAGPQNGMDKNAFQPHALMARFRSTAARIWLMTMMGRQDTETGREVALSAMTIWKALSVIEKPLAVERARDYIGSFYNGVSHDDINAGAWLPDEVMPV